jgi:Cu+-exporting ATPase
MQARDPVCGMAVDMMKAVIQSDYEGQTYYFCSLGCKRAFDIDPQHYAKLSGFHRDSNEHHANH